MTATLIGTIGDGGILHRFAHPVVDPMLPTPRGTGPWNAARIETGTLYPAYKRGSVVYFTSDRVDPASLNGNDCLVELDDGSIALRFLTVTLDRVFTLKSDDKSVRPLITKTLRSATPIAWVQR